MPTGDDIDDDVLDPSKDAVQDADDSAKEAGKATEAGKQAKKDAEDPNQDSADKAKNLSNDGADALDHAGKALDELGIDDPGLQDAANEIRDFTDEWFGGKPPPTQLPTAVYRIYWGARDAKEAIAEGLMTDTLSSLDGLAEQGTNAAGISQYVGDSPISSFLNRGPGRKLLGEALDNKNPFDTAEKEKAAESTWRVIRIWHNEAINELFRCELILGRPETKNQALEDSLAAQGTGGGLVDQLKSPVTNALALADRMEDTFNDVKNTIENTVDDITGFAKGLASDPDGTILGLLDGASSSGPHVADGPVYINVPLDPANFLGQTVSVRMAREIDPDVYSSRWVTGIVAEFDDLGIVQPQTATTSDRLIRIVIIPSLARLAVRRDCRVFQDLSALEIVREVFRAAGVYGFLPDIPGVAEATNFVSDLVEKIPVVGGAVSDALSGQYIRMMPPSGVTEDAWTHPREFCVQYRESDLDFVRRLLEEEGINFCFEMLRGIERIVFVHDPGTSEEVDTIDGRAIPFYWPDRTDRPIVEAVTEIGEMRKLRTNKVVLRDFNFADAALAPTELLSSEATAEAEGVAIERYEYPARAVYQYEEEADPKIYYRNYDATKDRDLAKLRLEEEITNARSVRVRCDVITSQAGRVLEVLGHFFRDQSTYGSRADRLLVRQLSLRGAGQGVPNLLYGGPNAPWMNPNAVDCSIEVVAQWLDPAKPERTPVRPRRQIPVPRITSLQTATVVDDDGSHSEDELLFTDDPKLSRIRVRFHWDRRGEVPLGIDLPLVDLGKSAWVRVAHGWAGADFGMLFTPRIGSEVLVAFEEGDPNRPLVIGMLYDGEHPVPVKDAAESTIHTRTTPWDEDDGVQSELTFFDKTDKEEIRFKAGRYLVEEVRRIHAMTVGRKQHAIVDRHHGEIVEGKQETVVVKKRTKTVRTDELVEIKGGHTHMIEGDHERMITASRKETVKGIEKLEIEENRSLTVNGDRVTEIGKKGAEPANDVHDVKGMRTDTVTGTLIVTAASTAIGQPGGEGASKPRAQVAAGETEDGAEVAIESEKGAKFVAGKEVTVTSDNDMIHVDATESIDVECEGEKLHIATVDGIALTSTARVQVHTDHGVLLITPEEVRLRAMGGEDAVTVVSADAVLVSGKTFVATATLEYEVQSSGPATHGG